MTGSSPARKMWSEAEPLSAGLKQAAAGSRACAAAGTRQTNVYPADRLLCLQAQGVQQ